MRYITPQELLVIHARIVDATGGAHGVRDVGLLLSLCERPKTSFGGKQMYPSVFAKAGVLCESLATYHVFVDGNKRTALAAATRFLHVNGYILHATNADAVKIILGVATKKLDISGITNWLKTHSREH